MIPLRKNASDHVVHGRGISWLAERSTKYKAARAAGKKISRFSRNYSDARVKKSLSDETSDKCAYCESKYGSVSFGDIDHSSPRSVDPDLLLDYDNLTIACEYCNIRKGAYPATELPLIDPFSEDPTTRIQALGPMLFPIPGTDSDERAANTLEQFELNKRMTLLNERVKVLAEAVRLVDAYRVSAGIAIRDAALESLNIMASRKGEFSLVIRSAWATILPEIPLPPLYPSGDEDRL